jgi:hypothetical protein
MNLNKLFNCVNEVAPKGAKEPGLLPVNQPFQSKQGH